MRFYRMRIHRVATTRPRMVKGGTRPYRDLILRDRLGHAGVKVKWEPVEARHSRMRQKKARITTGDQGESPGSLLCGRDAG